MSYGPDQYAAFLDSLKINNEGYESDEYEWPLDAPLDDFERYVGESETGISRSKMLYLINRCRLLQSNAKPSDLAEQVKAAVRAALDVYEDDGFDGWTKRSLRIADEFRRLSEAATRLRHERSRQADRK